MTMIVIYIRVGFGYIAIYEIIQRLNGSHTLQSHTIETYILRNHRCTCENNFEAHAVRVPFLSYISYRLLVSLNWFELVRIGWIGRLSTVVTPGKINRTKWQATACDGQLN